jgi:hypothetical protein
MQVVICFGLIAMTFSKTNLVKSFLLRSNAAALVAVIIVEGLQYSQIIFTLWNSLIFRTNINDHTRFGAEEKKKKIVYLFFID